MRTSTRTFAIRLLALPVLCAAVWWGAAAPAAAAPGPAWQLSLVGLPTNLAPETTGSTGAAPIYELIATNVGAGDATGPVELRATLPSGVTPVFDAEAPAGQDSDKSTPDPVCAKDPGQTIVCSAAGPVHPSRNVAIRIPVEVSAPAGAVLPDAVGSVESPGTTPVTASTPTTISNDPPPFGFLAGPAGLQTLFTEADGSSSLSAGVRPDQMTVNLGFPADQPEEGGIISGAGHPRDIVVELPRGLTVNPNAAGVCTEVQVLAPEGEEGGGCPASSQIGMATVVTELVGPQPAVSALYNMVPTAGSPATLAFDAANVGVIVHVIGGVRSEADYRIFAKSSDVLARVANPLTDVQFQLWGSPTGASHDQIRGECRGQPNLGPCAAADHIDTPVLTLPSDCRKTLDTVARARSWEESNEGIEGLPHTAAAQATSISGIPTEVSGCSLLEFEPTLTLQPDTTAAESPTGLHVNLHVPQHEGKDETATSNLKDVVATLPAGMAVNPASAGGLGACSPSQVGLTTPVGQENPIHFTNAPDNCPEAAKIGSVEVRTPLLDHPIPGAVYVATPHDNPFNSLLAIYISIKSPEDGIYAKLAGKVQADPNTGQLTTTFTENPELPVEDFKLEFFGGPRAALRTPADCGSYATTSVLTPWSGNPPVQTSNGFQVSSGPGGSGCTSSEAQRPNAPGFEAGTKTPIAASYSPFVMNLRRADGQQLLKGLDLTLPPGLSGKLAGVATCSDQAIASASGKTGREEQASPSCPANSQVGEVTVGAGAGSNPYYTTGKIYLAGPYQGAPLSFAIITPAVAGPYDLGTVVTRAAAHVDPITTQITVHSDPLPTILQGIPLQLRDIRVDMGRNQFTLNPTSCERMQLTGTATSALGQGASLANPFQVGGCRGLEFAPKLTLRLKGGTKRGKNPALTATLTARQGEANIARAQVSLPHSEFLDQAHIRTVCTRVQFNAGTGHGAQCPKGSIYGKARAITPLLDNPLEGPVFMRSSDHPLPDLVATLNGQIDVVLIGRIDSHKGGIRNTYDVVPDAPVSKFVLKMQGAKKGLLVNSTNICKARHRANVRFTAHNGAIARSKPVLKATRCHKAKRHRKHARKGKSKGAKHGKGAGKRG